MDWRLRSRAPSWCLHFELWIAWVHWAVASAFNLIDFRLLLFLHRFRCFRWMRWRMQSNWWNGWFDRYTYFVEQNRSMVACICKCANRFLIIHPRFEIPERGASFGCVPAWLTLICIEVNAYVFNPRAQVVVQAIWLIGFQTHKDVAIYYVIDVVDVTVYLHLATRGLECRSLMDPWNKIK